MKQDEILSLLGLAKRAGFVTSGEFSVEKSIKDGTARVVIIANDASSNTNKMFTNMCTYYNVPMFCYADKDTLGHAIGQEMRASAAITDAGLGDALLKKLNKLNNGGSKYVEN